MNWDQIILRAIVPISFLAIWVLTALFNRESKGFAPRVAPQPLKLGPRPTEPTLRWTPTATTSQPQPVVRKVPIGDDDIMIISGDQSKPVRVVPIRPGQAVGSRRNPKARPAASPPKKADSTTSTPKLGGVSQNVNQQLARPIELTPLTTIAPMTTPAVSSEVEAPASGPMPSTSPTPSALLALMNDPSRLREAFIVNDLLQRPVALRGRRRLGP